MSQIILGLPTAVFWMWFSAVVYITAIVIIWNPLRREKSELMYAFFAFLTGMAWLHVFIGAGVYWKQMLLSHIGFLGGLTGAVYTLKFPLSALSESKRKPLFYSALVIAWSIVALMLVFPHQNSTMIWDGYLFMIFTAGVAAGFYMVWWGIKAKERGIRIKGVVGGMGISTCCFLADVLVLYSLFFGMQSTVVSGHFFMWLAPIILIAAVLYGRHLEKIDGSKAG